MKEDKPMYTLLNSLAKRGNKGAELDEVENWIKSDLFSQDTAKLAFDDGYITIKRALYGLQSPNYNIVNNQDLNLNYTERVYLTALGFDHLQKLKPDSIYGVKSWQPNQKLRDFINKYNSKENGKTL